MMAPKAMSDVALKRSPIVCGCSRFVGDYPDYRLLDALQEGMNVFDLSEVRWAEEAQGAVRKLWEQHVSRESVVLQIGCGIVYRDTKEGLCLPHMDFSYETIIATVDAALRRYKTDYVDTLILRRPSMQINPEEVSRAFFDLRWAGKVQKFGVTNQSVDEIEWLSTFLDEPLALIKLPMNLHFAEPIDRWLPEELQQDKRPRNMGIVDYCLWNGIQIETYDPLFGGRFTRTPGNYTDPHNVGTWRLITQLAMKYGVSRNAILIAWLLQHPARLRPIIDGPLTLLRSCWSGVYVKLPKREWCELLMSAGGRQMPDDYQPEEELAIQAAAMAT